MMKEKKNEKDDIAMILVVDDDENFRSLLRLFLENHGYAVCEAGDGREALRLFTEQAPELILMDADMPVMNGFEACSQLTASSAGKDIPVIIVTVLQDEDSVNRAYDAGAADYVTKPIHWAVLRRRIKSIIDFNRNRKVLRQTRQAKRITEEKLHRARKIESMGLMLAGVAHDLNNSLAGIVAYPEILLMDLPEYSKLRQPLLEIQKSGNRAAATVADLLIVASGVTSVKEAHNLNRLVETYLESSECKKLLSLHPDVQCELNADAAQPFISCSTVHIRKSLLNLIGNATEAVSGKGIISISTSNQHITKKERSEFALPAGEYVVLSVCDNSSGITSEDAGHIFEPFYTKKSMGRSGSGLGLTIVWNAMHDHNGKVRVESSSKGTCFLLYFPVIAEQKSSSMIQQS